MSKILVKVAGLAVVFAVLFGGVAQAAEAGTRQQQESAAVQSTGETRAVVVGSLAFVLMLGAAGAVFWYTARSRHSPE
ncbi:hypothetical protein SAMN05421835_12252 [Amycolatopsis sacchari]|uniref:LPXTG-motif cell wall anchor domain-containing protein n=1 Tax=Amycolatopsis sacchari TaxID=115433 RepID=A0A1I3ZVJ7_9PSEU|nr:hypothetical protein [Amycolatopsis sacchari]SFK47957.1 hypothetical protein SAMN05421835_12252 [Amycolatopsis sacchari]